MPRVLLLLALGLSSHVAAEFVKTFCHIPNADACERWDRCGIGGKCLEAGQASFLRRGNTMYCNSDWTDDEAFRSRHCTEAAASRRKYSQHSEISLPGVAYGAQVTKVKCFEACEHDARCMQAVYNNNNRACYPMTVSSTDNEAGDNSAWTSYVCSTFSGKSDQTPRKFGNATDYECKNRCNADDACKAYSFDESRKWCMLCTADAVTFKHHGAWISHVKVPNTNGQCGYSCECAHGWSVDEETGLCDAALFCTDEDNCSGHGTADGWKPECTCKCDEGWTGPTCSKLACASNYCNNRGTLGGDQADGCTCSNCNAGWEGATCNAKKACASNHCNHRGKVGGNQVDGCTCSNCNAGWEGATCNSKKACSSNYCNNGGKVGGNQVDGCMCKCASGWEGANCAINIDDCAGSREYGMYNFAVTPAGGWDLVDTAAELNNHKNEFIAFYNAKGGIPAIESWQSHNCCWTLRSNKRLYIDNTYLYPHQNGQRCNGAAYSGTFKFSKNGNSVLDTLSSSNTFSEGSNCGDSSNPAIYWRGEGKCKNSATCKDGLNSFTCECAAGWEGATCDTKKACPSMHCNGRGNVSGNQVDGCSCACTASGWQGATCQTKTACASNYCNNRGTISGNQVDGCTCSNCNAGWEGATCNSKKACSSNYCNNGGTVSGNQVDGCTCSNCNAGWEGATCNAKKTCAAVAAPSYGSVSYSSGIQYKHVTLEAFSGRYGSKKKTAYTFAKVMPIRETGTYDQIQLDTCNAIGMKPVCDHGVYCATDTEAIFLGQEHHIAYKPHRDTAAYFPGGWHAVKDMFNGLCTYTSDHHLNHHDVHAESLCNIPLDTHAWKKITEANVGFMCASVGTVTPPQNFGQRQQYSKATFACNSGFTKSNSNTRTCINGAFSTEAAPTCTCASDKYISGSSCVACPANYECNGSTTKTLKSCGAFAVNADLVSAIHVGTGWRELTGWRTSGDAKGALVDESSGAWSNGAGRYTAKKAGYYRVSTNLRVDAHDSRYMRVLIAKNGNADYHNGLHSIEGNRKSTDYHSVTVDGLLKLAVGDYVSVFVYGTDSSWYVQVESGFAVNYLGADAIASSADLVNNRAMGTGWREVTGWRTGGDGAGALFDNSKGAWSNSNGRFTAKQTGYYRVSTQLRVDAHSSGYTRVLIAKNSITDVNNGLHSIKGNGESTDYTHMRAGGLVQLNAGEYV
eukprot:g7082.t1